MKRMLIVYLKLLGVFTLAIIIGRLLYWHANFPLPVCLLLVIPPTLAIMVHCSLDILLDEEAK